MFVSEVAVVSGALSSVCIYYRGWGLSGCVYLPALGPPLEVLTDLTGEISFPSVCRHFQQVGCESLNLFFSENIPSTLFSAKGYVSCL